MEHISVTIHSDVMPRIVAMLKADIQELEDIQDYEHAALLREVLNQLETPIDITLSPSYDWIPTYL